MRNGVITISSLFILMLLPVGIASGGTQFENFDTEPGNWEGVNNRCTHFAPRPVTQDFRYSADTSHAGGAPGEMGGRIQAAAEPAFCAYRLPKRMTFDDALHASGRIYIAKGSGNFLLGFFNAGTLNEWRTPNTMVARLNGRGEEGFHCHAEYGTSMWRFEAGVIGEIVRGQRIEARALPADTAYEWKMEYDPKGGDGYGLLTFSLNGEKAVCTLLPEHRADGASFTHFGVLPVMKGWDEPNEFWLDDVSVNGQAFDFSQDPNWDEMNNRRTYETWNCRPNFDFGWSATTFAGGEKPGELGGLIFRGDCRYPEKLASYGCKIETLSLNTPLYASGKVCVTRAVSDSTASIGFYNAASSMEVNPSQTHGIPKDYVGIYIEGPSPEGFYFYPVYRVHGDEEKALDRHENAPKIHPDGKLHDWVFRYDPNGGDGSGEISVELDSQKCVLPLEPGHKAIGASFNRYGICTPWIDGNSVTVYFDDITYTCSASLKE